MNFNLVNLIYFLCVLIVGELVTPILVSENAGRNPIFSQFYSIHKIKNMFFPQIRGTGPRTKSMCLIY